MELWCLADGQLMGREGCWEEKRKEGGWMEGKERQDVDVAIKSDGDDACSKRKEQCNFFF